MLAVAAAVPLLVGFMPGLQLPARSLPACSSARRCWRGRVPTRPIRALSVLGLSLLLFLAVFEADVRRFRGRTGAQVLVGLIGSLALATAVGSAFDASGMCGGPLVGIAFLATSLGLIVPGLADAVVLQSQRVC